MQVDAYDVIGLKLVRDFAVAYAGDHGCQIFSLFHEVFVANRIVEPFTDGNIGELDSATVRKRGHEKTGRIDVLEKVY